MGHNGLEGHICKGCLTRFKILGNRHIQHAAYHIHTISLGGNKIPHGINHRAFSSVAFPGQQRKRLKRMGMISKNNVRSPVDHILRESLLRLRYL